MNEKYKVTYRNDDGTISEELYLRRVVRSRINDVVELQKLLLESFLKNNAAIGPCIAEDNTWKTMKKLASLIRVVGNDKPGFDIDRLEEDYEQLTALFFSTALTDEGELNTEEAGWLLKPSLIARLHGLNWEEDVKKIWTNQVASQTKQLEPEQTIETPST